MRYGLEEECTLCSFPQIPLLAIPGIIFLLISTYLLAKSDPAQFMTAPRDGFSPDSFCALLTTPVINAAYALPPLFCLHFKHSHLQDIYIYIHTYIHACMYIYISLWLLRYIYIYISLKVALAWWARIQSHLSCREHYPYRLIWKSRGTIGCVYLPFLKSFKSTSRFFHSLNKICYSSVSLNQRQQRKYNTRLQCHLPVRDKISNFTTNQKTNYINIRNSSTRIKRLFHNCLSDVLKAAASL